MRCKNRKVIRNLKKYNHSYLYEITTHSSKGLVIKGNILTETNVLPFAMLETCFENKKKCFWLKNNVLLPRSESCLFNKHVSCANILNGEGFASTTMASLFSLALTFMKLYGWKMVRSLHSAFREIWSTRNEDHKYYNSQWVKRKTTQWIVREQYTCTRSLWNKSQHNLLTFPLRNSPTLFAEWA